MLFCTKQYVIFFAIVFAAYWAHLSAYYAQGSNLMPSAGEIGEYREKHLLEPGDMIVTNT